jgi:hypothetical protein
LLITSKPTKDASTNTNKLPSNIADVMNLQTPFFGHKGLSTLSEACEGNLTIGQTFTPSIAKASLTR